MDYTKPISIFKDYFSTKSGLNCSVGDFCSNVYYGDYQEEVMQMRAEKDKKKRDVRDSSGLFGQSGPVSLGTGSGDDSLAWIAIAWLIVAMSHLARRLGRRWGRWAAGLAISAAVTVLVGLLVLAAPAELL